MSSPRVTARGAALQGLKPTMVESRKSRWSYGIGVHRAFDPDLDSDGNEDSFPANGMRVTGCIQWLIRWDDNVKEKAKWIHGCITMKRTGSATETVGDRPSVELPQGEKLTTQASPG
ncbi:uncharacterized protein PADG_11712 [Paracoccidioides brasiliensis Pb18]|uniref:Uncharacterized protein n=1 Tax=Paracoccidioides brasiliensis (strain Pb18) TaxID=502780 RepID=A0A0A0HSJ7_PARBD|nr:uncharacterized protein PADG_11712 [Paracoccidioides brasiliensis Pb18]KGM92174.1 hypothetical protein PADG_11712 [Paracoccidioides brasiliensis Pb18]